MATAIEYGLIAALIGVAAITGISTVSQKTTKPLATASSSLTPIPVSTDTKPWWASDADAQTQFTKPVGGRCFAITYETTPVVREIPCDKARSSESS